MRTSLNRLRQRRQRVAHRLPVVDAEHTAAGVRVQSDDLRARCLDEALQLLDFEQRHAELRVHARGAHLVVMSAALTGIDTHEQLATLEQLRPLLERMQVVERDPDALLHRPFVFGARREVRREQDALAIDALAASRGRARLRRATRTRSRGPRSSNTCRICGMPVGLHRIEDSVDARQRLERLRARLERLAVVDESSAMLAAEREQLVATILPPLLAQRPRPCPRRRTALPRSGRARDRQSSCGSRSRAAARPADRPALRR